MKFLSTRISLSTYITSIILLFAVTFGTDRVVTAMAENAVVADRKVVVIDAGHGGVDGGATSCTGVLESNINLEIALKLDDLFHLLGMKTKMIRTTDCSVYTQGDTIAAKKVSDLKERVRIVNEAENAVLVSIHQNYFDDGRYSGAQVFYRNDSSSKTLADMLQKEFIGTLNLTSKRATKKASGIYLIEHIQQPGVLIECGFLSNPSEEAALRSKEYQQSLCCVIASVCSRYLSLEKALA